ncbi:MAG: glycosyltransferase family 2 protein [Ruminococcaceae bacterium]|nr:glycosyltransferase family 2 protein [Oscillospiraceae bacterium]
MISVIIPVHNTEKYIDRCVQSVLTNTYKDIEIILVENGSTDRSLEICRKYEKDYANIKVIVADQVGVSHARNLGMDVAKGEYFSFIDADDYISPYLYETVWGQLSKSGCEIVIFKLIKGSEENYRWTESDYVVRTITLDTYYHDVYVRGYAEYIAATTKVFSRKLLGELRFNESIAFTEDRLFYTQLMPKTESICVIDAELYYYNVGNINAISKNKHAVEKRMSQVSSVELAIEYMRKCFPQKRLWVESMEACLLQEADFWRKRFKKWGNYPNLCEELRNISHKAASSLMKAKDLPKIEKYWVLLTHYCPIAARIVYSVFRCIRR